MEEKPKTPFGEDGLVKIMLMRAVHDAIEILEDFKLMATSSDDKRMLEAMNTEAYIGPSISLEHLEPMIDNYSDSITGLLTGHKMAYSLCMSVIYFMKGFIHGDIVKVYTMKPLNDLELKLFGKCFLLEKRAVLIKKVLENAKGKGIDKMVENVTKEMHLLDTKIDE
jgi:hypothetical protein